MKGKTFHVGFVIANKISQLYNPSNKFWLYKWWPVAMLDSGFKKFLVRLVVMSVAMLVVVKILPWAEVSDPAALIVSAALLGLFNSILRPLLILLTLPINIISFGLFTFVINGVILYVIAFLVPGFEIAGLGAAVLTSIMISIVVYAINRVVRDKQ